MKKLKIFINDGYKNKSWFTRNYFFAGTVLIILINILIFAIGGEDWVLDSLNTWKDHWTDVFYFKPLIRVFCNSFAHFTWRHVLLNMLCFFFCGLYLERKTGSIKFVLLILAAAFFTSAAVSANFLAVHWQGFSAVNFGLYAYITVDYLFSLQKEKRTKFNLISGAVVLVFIYFTTCFDGAAESLSFKWYPYDLARNMGHYSGALAGLVLGLTVQIARIGIKKNKGI